MFTVANCYKKNLFLKKNHDYYQLAMSRFLTENILVFLMQYIGLSFNTSSSPLWLASGTACGFLFLRGYSVLPGIWIGSFAQYSLTGFHLSLASSYATIYTLQAFLLLWLSYRCISPTLLFYRTNCFIRFIICSLLLTLITHFLLTWAGDDSVGFSYVALQNWLANLNGILIVSFALITWDAYFPQIDQLKQLNKWLLTFYFGALFICIFCLLLSKSFSLYCFNLAFLFFWTLLISLYYGWCGTVAALFLSGFLVNLLAYIDTAAFNSLTNVIFLQITLVLQFFFGLCISINKEARALNNPVKYHDLNALA